MSGYYRPPWYPNQDPFHNPWAMNGETGSAAQTFYEDWLGSLEDGELERLIAEHREQAERGAAA